MLIPRFVLAAMLALLAWFVRNDRAEYERFKLLTSTQERQRAFRRWTIRSFLFFCGASLAVLAVLGRLGALVWMPPEFTGLSPRLANADFGPGFAAGLIGAVVVGGLIGAAGARLRRGRASRPPKLLGDIAPLFPRNRAERRWTALLAANAGPSEELFFRLALPLAIVAAGGGALLAFAAAGLVFGLAHFYQGWLGVAATTFIGLVMAGLYLATGIIWVPVLLHSLINLNSLWLRPLLAERRGRA